MDLKPDRYASQFCICGFLLAVLSFVVAGFTVNEELNTADGNRADEEHMNVTTLVHDKLQDKPKDH